MMKKQDKFAYIGHMARLIPFHLHTFWEMIKVSKESEQLNLFTKGPYTILLRVHAIITSRK